MFSSRFSEVFVSDAATLALKLIQSLMPLAIELDVQHLWAPVNHCHRWFVHTTPRTRHRLRVEDVSLFLHALVKDLNSLNRFVHDDAKLPNTQRHIKEPIQKQTLTSVTRNCLHDIQGLGVRVRDERDRPRSRSGIQQSRFPHARQSGPPPLVFSRVAKQPNVTGTCVQ